jgi:hypothetical protein
LWTFQSHYIFHRFLFCVWWWISFDKRIFCCHFIYYVLWIVQFCNNIIITFITDIYCMYVVIIFCRNACRHHIFCIWMSWLLIKRN